MPSSSAPTLSSKLTAHLIESLQQNVPFVKKLRILGLISYAADDDPEERFFKIDFTCHTEATNSPKESSNNTQENMDCTSDTLSNKLNSSQIITPLEEILNKSSEENYNGSKVLDSSSSSHPSCSSPPVIHSSPTMSILSNLSHKSKSVRPHMRYTLLHPDSMASPGDGESSTSNSAANTVLTTACTFAAGKNRRDRRKLRKPKRQSLINASSNTDDGSSIDLAIAENNKIEEDALSIENDLDTDEKVDDTLVNNESQNKINNSFSNACQLDSVEDTENSVSKEIFTSTNAYKAPDNVIALSSNALTKGLALISQNAYGLLLRGPLTFSASAMANLANNGLLGTINNHPQTTVVVSEPLKEMTTTTLESSSVSSTFDKPINKSSRSSSYNNNNNNNSLPGLENVSSGGGGKGSYKCRYCDKLFNRKFCRERHERLHTGVKPYTCEVCTEKFIRLEDKKRHLRLIHPGSNLEPENTSPLPATLDS